MKILSVGFVCLLFAIQAHAVNRGLSVQIPDESGNSVQLYSESYALLIGASNYQNGWSVLPGVKKDVKAVKTILEKHGFKVLTVADPDLDSLRIAFESFISKYGRKFENRLLFYFSGHGFTLKQKWGGEMGYIVPVDAPNPNNDLNGFLDKALDMQLIDVYAKKIQSKHAIFLFDSCFSGSIFALSKAAPAGITYKTSRPVRQFITAGNAEEEVPDKSIFRSQFVAALSGEGDTNNDGYITGSELGEYLQNSVINYSHNAQHPQYGKIRHPKLDKGDIVFQLSTKRRKIIDQTSRKATSIDAEETLWKVIENSEAVEDFQDYLTEYPNGKFKVSARIKIRQLKRKKLQIAGGTMQTESAGEGIVNISTTPSGSKIFVGGVLQGISPISLKLKAGAYYIQSKKAGYKTESKRVTVAGRKKIQLGFFLDPVGADLFISSDPSSANVYLDNKYQGVTPLQLKGLVAGTHRLRVEKESYYAYEKSIAVKESDRFDINAELKYRSGKKSGIKVGLVFDAGGKYDRSFNQSAWEGASKARDELGIMLKDVQPGNSSAVEEAMKSFAAEDYDIILGIGFGNATAVENAAKAYPSVKFAIVDAVVDLPNVTSLLFKEHEGSYLVGLIAAMRSRVVDGKRAVGFIGGMEIPLIQKFEVGFREGARKIYPDIKFIVNYVGNTPTAWNDPAKAKEIAKAQMGKGASVIYAVAGGSNNGLYNSLRETNGEGPCYPEYKNGRRVDSCIYGIGVDSNKNYIVPGQIVTSMLKRVDVAVYDTIRKTAQNTLKGGFQIYGTKDNGVGVALDKYNKRLVNSKMKKVVDLYYKKIAEGEIVVPSRRSR